MASSVKTKSKKVGTNHKCLKASTIKRQGELIERIGKVTLGNGTPEDGLLFKFRTFLEDHNKMVENINDLKVKVEQSLTDSATTRHAFELYKTHEEGAEEGEKEIKERAVIAKNLKETQLRDRWQKVIWVTMGIIAIASIWVNIWLNNKNSNVVETKVDNLGEPVVVNPRGEIVNLPSEYSLKMWPNDFDKGTQDTTKQ